MTIDDARRWAAVVRRDASFDGQFVYCVKSTKIFCRPICKARLARRMNVEFCDTPAQAEAKGFRPCKRCQPLLASYNPEADKIKIACDILKALPTDAPLPGLEKLAQAAGLTKHHFHRLFKRETGQTPREYALACRGQQGSTEPTSDSLSPITPFSSESNTLPTPTTGGADVDWNLLVDAHDLETFDLIGYTLDDDLAEDFPLNAIDFPTIHYNIAETVFGRLLVAFKEDRVCKLELGTTESELMASLQAAFPPLYYIHAHVSQAGEPLVADYQQRIVAVVDALEHPSGKMVDVPIALEAEENLT